MLIAVVNSGDIASGRGIISNWGIVSSRAVAASIAATVLIIYFIADFYQRPDDEGTKSRNQPLQFVE